ncbi:hypothetical protein SeLEV6574_g08360 [Synchytrium endobioticum]|uniref:histidine kinase n=1 Tax=Synchytrium endobioticum TaxID=286115 RepID=A0A507BWC6_9FUNG|nr:hypothetical protein SeLEV6574_g08360 [Synchytrium endobioticum]
MGNPWGTQVSRDSPDYLDPQDAQNPVYFDIIPIPNLFTHVLVVAMVSLLGMFAMVWLSRALQLGLLFPFWAPTGVWVGSLFRKSTLPYYHLIVSISFTMAIFAGFITAIPLPDCAYYALVNAFECIFIYVCTRAAMRADGFDCGSGRHLLILTAFTIIGAVVSAFPAAAILNHAYNDSTTFTRSFGPYFGSEISGVALFSFVIIDGHRWTRVASRNLGDPACLLPFCIYAFPPVAATATLSVFAPMWTLPVGAATSIPLVLVSGHNYGLAGASLAMLAYCILSVIALFKAQQQIPSSEFSVLHLQLIQVTMVAMAALQWHFTKKSIERRNYVESLVDKRTPQLRLMMDESTKAKESHGTALEEKSQFIEVLCHEFRNSLDVLMNMVEPMLEGSKGNVLPLPLERQQALKAIEASSAYLLNLINDALDINAFETGKVQLHTTPVDINAILIDIVDTARDLIKKGNVNLRATINHTAMPKAVALDCLRFVQVMSIGALPLSLTAVSLAPT